MQISSSNKGKAMKLETNLPVAAVGCYAIETGRISEWMALIWFLVQQKNSNSDYINMSKNDLAKCIPAKLLKLIFM
jgi:hypothetical protein